MTVHGAYSAVRRAMAGLMFLSAALVTKNAFAAWQADDAALFAVGGIALFAVAAAIHFRTGQLQERARAAEVQKTTLNARLRLEAELKAAGIHVLTIRNQGAAGPAIRGGILEALADLLSPAGSAQVAAAIDGLAENGESLSMRCAGRIAGETYAVNGFASGAGDTTLILRDCTREQAKSAELSAEIEHLRILLDAVEMPIWQHAANLDLSWVNKSYAHHVDSSARRVEREHGPELIS